MCQALGWILQTRGIQTFMSKQNRVEQTQAICGACKAFWENLDALASRAVAPVTLLLFVPGQKQPVSSGETPKRLPKISAAQDTV